MTGYLERANVVVVVGTRPEAIKLAPVINLMSCMVVTTGQHPEMAREALAEFGITPDVELPHSQDIIGSVLSSLPPGPVVVQGDTASAFSAAVAAYRAGYPVYHVEAGLRSGDLSAPWPEEGYRRMIGHIATTHFCPTETAAANLAREGIVEGVHVVGNTVLDAVRIISQGFLTEPHHRPDILVTLHRREAIGESMEHICADLAAFGESSSLNLVVLAHPNPAVRAIIHKYFPEAIDPLPYREFLSLLAASRIVVTDSGGLQEECSYLGVPCVIAREVTERTEAVDAGCAVLAGFDVVGALQALDDPATYRTMSEAPCPFGDGFAAEKITTILQ